MAYAAWSVIAGEQPPAAKWNILGTNDSSFNDGTGIGAGVIFPGHLISGLSTSSWASIDYSGTSTVVGWSSFTLKSIRYTQVGKLVAVWFDLRGTSNSTSATFTVAVAAKNNSADYENVPGLNMDNSVIQTSPGRIYLDPTASTTLVNISKAGGSLGWTASGTKDLRGMLIYEAA